MSSDLYGYARNGPNGSNGDDDNDEDFFAGGSPDEDVSDLVKIGGSKQENERTFSVEFSNAGSPSYEGGRFISTSSYNAAKKAATAIFKHLDTQMGLVKGDKKKGKSNHVKKVEFILYRHDKKNPVKYYRYGAERVQADKPVIVERVINKGSSNPKVVKIAFSQSVSIKRLNLSEEYILRNKEAQKEFNAKKRALKKKEEAKLNPEKKTRKARKTKKPASMRIASIQDVVDALSVSPKKAATKKPKAAKKATKKAAAKKPKAAKKVSGGGYCSFF